MDARASVCIFVKVPRAGAVKTRLASAVGYEGAALLARAFFLDTLATVRALGWAHTIVAADGALDEFESELRGVEVWQQGEGDLGERLERVLARALESTPCAIAIGSDTPTLPARHFVAARVAVERGTAALGPCADGGFYLLASSACPHGLFAALPWSAPDTCARTAERLRAHGFNLTLLEPSYDVDHPADLVLLREQLERGEASAPHTARALIELEHAPRRTVK